MPAVNNVLVVGAGLAGAGVAIHLASAGVAVDSTPMPSSTNDSSTMRT